MDRGPHRPLSVEEAKDRLRLTVTEMVPFGGGDASGYLKRHPYAALAALLAAGFILGKSSTARKLVTSALLLKL